MLNYLKTTIFDSPAQTLVNPVNTVGVMGKGLAAQFKHRFPEMFQQYKQICERKELDIGILWLYKSPSKWVINFPTKKHWRSPSKIEHIQAGLQQFVDTYSELEIDSIAFPQLGSGHGGLDFPSEVQPLMEEYLSPLPISIYLHIPTINFSSLVHTYIKRTG